MNTPRESSPEATHEPPQWYDDGLRFTCNQCGNCCTGPQGYVWFTSAEAKAMAEYLGVSVEEFMEQYTKRVDGRPSLTENYNRSVRGYDCVFLDRDEQGKALCGIYPVRPAQCRTWPFWRENLASPRAWQRASRDCEGMTRGNAGQGKFFPIEQIRILRDETEL